MLFRFLSKCLVRPMYLNGCGIVAVVCSIVVASPLHGSRPNIVLLLADDFDFRFLGICRNTNPDDPQLVYKSGDMQRHACMSTIGKQNLADMSAFKSLTSAHTVVFDKAYVTSAIFTPSRTSVLTGRHSSYFKVDSDINVNFTNYRTSDGEDFLPRLFKRAGYVTGFVGKWHIHVADESTAWSLAQRWNMSATEHEKRNLLGQIYDAQVGSIRGMGYDFVEAVYSGNIGKFGKFGSPLQSPSAIEEMKRLGLNQHNHDWILASALTFIHMFRSTPFFCTSVPH